MKIGDRVKVIDYPECSDDSSPLGWIGTVIRIDDLSYPVEVYFTKTEEKMVFLHEELEVVN